MAEDDASPPNPPRAGRRLLVLRGTGLLGAAALPGCVTAPAGGGFRTGINDNDPSDGPGQGRGGNRAAQQRRTGQTDSDPNDGPGQGRGGARSTGRSDSDPNDSPGRGRGTVRRTSDSDPYDAAGQGRR